MDKLLDKIVEAIEEIYDAGAQTISDFWFWYDDQDENTQSFVTLIFALLLLLMWQSVVK